MRHRRACLAAVAASLAATLVLAVPRAEAASTVTHGCVNSVPEPGTVDPVAICFSLFRPAGASLESPVPLIFHSHGWAGSRTKAEGSFASWTDAGFGVLSFDQRGFGESGGKAHVENPDYEGQDVQRLVDEVGGLDWVLQESPGDPVLGAIGGSYGGGYQFVGAFTELRDRGATRFDALAPEITWWDLRESLAPQEVVRTAWTVALYAAGVDAHTDTVHQGFAYGAATGDWPNDDDGLMPNLDAFFEKNGPAWHASQGRLLDIPVLFGQGTTDNLFNLNQGLANFDGALTPAARAESIFVGYNGGHALPNLLPAGTGGSGDPCSRAIGGGSFGDLARQFMRAQLLGDVASDAGLDAHRGRYHIATPAGRCVTVGSVAADHSYDIADVVVTSAAGAPTYIPLAQGPLTIAGRPEVDAAVTTVAPDARLFFALAVGTSPTDARVVQDNMMPLREATAVSSTLRSIELPAVAIDVPAGQTLFLLVSPVSDMSFGHGSRLAGPVILANPVVRVPIVG